MRPMVIAYALAYGSGISVNTDLAIDLCDNGKPAAAWCALRVAPITGGSRATGKPGGACWYVATNGSPMLVAYETDDGIELHPDAALRLKLCGFTADTSSHPAAVMLAEALSAADND